MGKLDQVVGGVTHGRHDDEHGTKLAAGSYDLGDMMNATQVLDRCSAELNNAYLTHNVPLAKCRQRDCRYRAQCLCVYLFQPFLIDQQIQNPGRLWLAG